MALINRLDSRDPGFASALSKLLAFEATEDESIDRAAAGILADVRARGDAALVEYTQRFDRMPHASADTLEVPKADWHAALAALPAAQRDALQAAAERVRRYHERQRAETWTYTEADGTVLGQQVTPLDRVGLYVPGGKAAYPSSVLMNAIPAKVAGVQELVMVTPTPDGARNPIVLAAAAISGVDRVFAIGGAQAVGALAYGTATVPAVDKIVGPGNAYVAAAKRRVFGVVGIDMIAGPSEILVICDGKTPADWIAMDLFSQAEHDELAQSILLCPDAAFIAEVEAAIARLLPTMPRADILRTSLANRGALIQVRDLDEACRIANDIAPEHLEISTEQPEIWTARIRHAGAIFMGRFSSEALGDYCAGPNHVLPTSRTARFSSPLGVYDFQKRSSLIQVSHQGAQTLGRIAAELALGEGLQAHAASAQYRIDQPMSEVAGRIAGTIRPDIRKLTAYPVAHAEGCIKLDAMESPYELPEAVRDDLARVLRDTPLNRYPAADLTELRQAVKTAFGVPAGAGVLFGNGSDELIHIVVQACCNPGEVVLAPWPSFVYFDMAARFDHARFVGVPLAEDLSLDLPAMLAAIREHQPKVVFLAVPNNPTGGAWSDADMAAIIAAAPGLVVVDEAYQPFTDRSWMPRLLDAPNVVVMRTVSKIGLAGLRFGYLAGHPDWVAELDKVRPPYNLDVLTQAALLTVLRHKAVLDEQAARLRADREPLAAALAALPGVRVFPSAANFILARFSGKLDGNAVHLALKQRKILVRNFSNAHPLLAGCLRISVGSPDENAALLSALQDILSA